MMKMLLRVLTTFSHALDSPKIPCFFPSCLRRHAGDAAPFQNKSIDFLSDDFSIKYSNHIRISILYIHSVRVKGRVNIVSL
jgi:hypothetical protein